MEKMKEAMINKWFDDIAKEHKDALDVQCMQVALAHYVDITEDKNEEVRDAINRVIFSANDPLCDNPIYIDYADACIFNRLYMAWKEDDNKDVFVKVFDILRGETLIEYLEDCLERLTSEEQINNREYVKTVYEKYIKKEN